MNHQIIVYAFLQPDGTEDEFTTLDVRVAFLRVAGTKTKVIERRYELKESKIVRTQAQAIKNNPQYQEAP